MIQYHPIRWWSPRSTWTLPAQPPAFRGIAPHIRGRVYRVGETWFMEVKNTNTGKVLATDNTNSRTSILNACNEAVSAARGAWTYELRQKDLK